MAGLGLSWRFMGSSKKDYTDPLSRVLSKANLLINPLVATQTC